jgi:hypothetical protein
MLHLPLRTILVNYSIGYIVYYGIVFLLIAYVFKNKWLAIIQLGFYIWFASDTFYWMQSELQQGISFLVLYISILIFYSEKNRSQAIWIVSIVMLPTCLFFHPLMIFSVIFVLIYIYFIERCISTSTFFLQVAIALIAILIKQYFFANAYDQKHMEGLTNFFVLFPNYFKTQSFKNFLLYVKLDYFVWLLFTCMVFYKLWVAGKRKAVLFTSLFALAYLVIINVTNKYGGEKFYFDNMYAPVGLFLSIGIFVSGRFIFEKHPRLLFVLLAVTIIRIVMVYRTHTIYSNRIAWHKEMIIYCRKTNNAKLYLTPNDSLNKILIMNWGVAYESLLLSSLDENKGVSYFFTTPASLDTLRKYSNKIYFITAFEKIQQSKLPKEYFNLPFTQYCIIKTNL